MNEDKKHDAKVGTVSALIGAVLSALVVFNAPMVEQVAPAIQVIDQVSDNLTGGDGACKE